MILSEPFVLFERVTRNFCRILQNGMLLVFDTRQTKGPLHSLSGLSTNPVHTIHSVVDDSGSTKIISASSTGPCIWDVDGNENRYLAALKSSY